MNNPTLIITTAFQTWIQAHKELSHLKKYQGRKGHVNPKLWTPEFAAAASSIEVRRLMYLRGDIHKMSIPDHKTGKVGLWYSRWHCFAAGYLWGSLKIQRSLATESRLLYGCRTPCNKHIPAVEMKLQHWCWHWPVNISAIGTVAGKWGGRSRGTNPHIGSLNLVI